MGTIVQDVYRDADVLVRVRAGGVDPSVWIVITDGVVLVTSAAPR